MGYTVVVAEKPSVGRDIARVLGCRRNENGALWGDNLVVTWAVGHLVTLCEPDEINEQYKKWRMDDLPIIPDQIPLKVIPKTKSQFQLVKWLITAKDVETVVCATDAGREGELIFRYIYQKSGCTKPVKRLWISSMTDESIRTGWTEMKPGSAYDGLYRSAQCRSQADWLVGMNASRAFTLRYDALLSVGRVQTPTLAILVRRRKEIEAFQPEQYFTVKANFGDYTGVYFYPGKEHDTRIATRAEAEKIAAVKGKTAIVQSAASKPEKELPPLLFDLTALQREANRLLSYTAEKTLKTAQSLYETKKAITYPRTDSRHLPPDMIPRLKQAMEKLHPSYQVYLPLIMPDGRLPITQRTVNAAKVTDHHAILPTPKTIDPDKLSLEERQLYDLITRRTMAAFAPPHLYDATKVVTVAEGHAFRSTGRVVTQAGWRAIPPLANPLKAKNTEEETGPLPALQPGDARSVMNTTIQAETTKPPAHHTDASLLGAMEHAGRALEDEQLQAMMKGSGIGTPATRAAIIQRIIQVGYAVRKGKTIVATDKGVQLIGLMPEELASAETTGKWELALDKIAKGQGDDQRFMEGIRKFSAFLVDTAKTSQAAASFPPQTTKRGGRKGKSASKQTPLGTCPLCGKGSVLENRAAFYCSRYREGCGLTLWKNALEQGQGPALNDQIVRLLLEKKTLVGRSGILKMDQSRISFTPTGSHAPSMTRPLEKVTASRRTATKK